jgi:hypothetical protein
MAYTKYSLTPASNNAAPPDGAPEGMLPSAVNDTMRDMMSQIRDCGDGLRDGTYTMTAVKITGGTITGVTFTSIAVTGGSITGITDLAVADGGTGASTAADARTNLAVPGTAVANTFTAKQTFSNSTGGSSKFPNILEAATVSATASTGTINLDLITQSIVYYTTNASGNFTLNFRGDGTTSLNTLMSTGESISATFLCTNGSTAYYNSAVTIDGTSVTPKWQGGTAPTSGNASSVDVYTYVIVKTGSATYTVFAAVTKFA